MISKSLARDELSRTDGDGPPDVMRVSCETVSTDDFEYSFVNYPHTRIGDNPYDILSLVTWRVFN